MLDHPREAGRPAGFWIRALAAMVDALVFVLVRASLHALSVRGWDPGIDGPGVSVGVFLLLFTCLYTTTLHALEGQTLGKMVAGIRVVGAEGEPLLPGAALLRYLGYFASIATLGLGFLMAGLRGDGRALHDLLAGSRVEWLPVRPRSPEPDRGPSGAETTRFGNGEPASAGGEPGPPGAGAP